MSRNRRGFTLIELLVVIAIIAILVALLLPAVQQVREAARRSQCQDHLHNLVVGLHSYEGSHKAFAPGIISDWYSYRVGGTQMTGASGNHGSRANWTWGAMLLPFIEQKPLYDRLGVGSRRASDAVQNWTQTRLGFTTPIDLFRCPSDNGPEVNDGNSRVTATTSGTQRGTILTNYIGVNRGGRSQAYEVVNTALHTESRIGTFIVNTAVRIPFITDGVSNTVLLGERAWRYNVGTATRQSKAGNALVVRGYTGTTFDCGGEGCGLSRAVGCLGGTPNPANADQRGEPINGQTSNSRAQNGFSSLHAGGAQFALGDGKVTFISQNIDLGVAGNLGAIADGQPVRVP
jgi:prepilin-type N-terminal cleavage/methylation domain-containing protein